MHHYVIDVKTQLITRTFSIRADSPEEALEIAAAIKAAMERHERN